MGRLVGTGSGSPLKKNNAHVVILLVVGIVVVL